MSHPDLLLVTRPTALKHNEFIAEFKDIYEHSEWVAQAAWEQIQAAQEPSVYDNRIEFRALLRDIVEQSDDATKHALLCLHPDLAGKAALSGNLTSASTSEQAGAGLDQCTPEELDRFTQYNATYKAKFGFPFIMAVKGATKFDILAGFESRIDNGESQEFQMALNQVHRIASFRLEDK